MPNDRNESAKISARRPPRVLIIMPDQWTRALLRAALREEGYDAIGSRGLREAFRIRQPDPERGPLRAVVLDHDAVSSSDEGALVPRLLERLGVRDAIFVRRATRPLPAGPWNRVLQRPVSVDDIVAAVRAMMPLPARARHPVD